jgi:23S rRNA (cytidine1920-2'-O)/16S rRNA (cytidine1409-2'-O)-methyltransferase
VLGYRSSGLPGPKGNLETFIWLAEPSRAGGARDFADIEQMAREVEP